MSERAEQEVSLDLYFESLGDILEVKRIKEHGNHKTDEKVEQLEWSGTGWSSTGRWSLVVRDITHLRPVRAAVNDESPDPPPIVKKKTYGGPGFPKGWIEKTLRELWLIDDSELAEDPQIMSPDQLTSHVKSSIGEDVLISRLTNTSRNTIVTGWRSQAQ